MIGYNRLCHLWFFVLLMKIEHEYAFARHRSVHRRGSFRAEVVVTSFGGCLIADRPVLLKNLSLEFEVLVDEGLIAILCCFIVTITIINCFDYFKRICYHIFCLASPSLGSSTNCVVKLCWFLRSSSYFVVRSKNYSVLDNTDSDLAAAKTKSYL